MCVAARTSAFFFKGKTADIREIGQKLGVEAIVEGSVRKAGSALRIAAQLINVADGYHLWTERYDCEIKDIFAIQDEEMSQARLLWGMIVFIGIKLQITWQKQPAADMVLDMLANQPEDPAGRIAGSATREEPCGKQRYRDGVLLCRKLITPWIGSGKGPDLLTFRIAWSGKAAGGLASVEVDNFCGAKETAIGWIDGTIPKIANSK